MEKSVGDAISRLRDGMAQQVAHDSMLAHAGWHAGACMIAHCVCIAVGFIFAHVRVAVGLK